MKRTAGSRIVRAAIVVGASLLLLALLPLLSAARNMSTSVTIVNNSGGEIRNVYLSHVDADDWSGNQLTNGSLTNGQATTLNEVACDGQQIKVIAEDANGCFAATVVNCGQSATWTITADTARDCGN